MAFWELARMRAAATLIVAGLSLSCLAGRSPFPTPVASSTWGEVTSADPDGAGPLQAGPERIEGMLVVDLADGADPGRVGADHGIGLEYVSAHSVAAGLTVCRVDDSGLGSLLQSLRRDRRVRSVSPNYLYYATGYSSQAGGLLAQDGDFPNDPGYAAQWNMRMVNVESGWKKARGQGATVAVVDTGLAYKNWEQYHRVEDLDRAEVVAGYDFVNGREEAVDDHGHGTHVAGTIAQSTNNGKGVVGVAFEARLMPIKVLRHNGSGTLADVAAGIRFAADRRANVINLGLSAPNPHEVMEEAVKYARAKGCLIVASAGNTGNDKVQYPAAYPQCLAISALDSEEKLTYYTTRGPRIDLSAPGGDPQKGYRKGILQNTIARGNPRRSDYYEYSGGSMATAHVSGVAALVVSTGVTDPDAVTRVLKGGARSKGDKGRREGFGEGVVDAGRAVAKAERLAVWQGVPLGLGLALLTGWLLGRRYR